MQFVSHNTQETEQFGEEVAKSLRGGDVLAFTGSLGMGKTAFTRGLARGLGCRGRVTSPTVTIVNEYDGKTPLFHFDMYRLGSSPAAACAPSSGASVCPTRCRTTRSMSTSRAAKKMKICAPSRSQEEDSHENSRSGNIC